jgi:hypothetical protein
MNRYFSQTVEAINRNEFVNLALKDGYNVFLPVYDGAVDFILHRESDGTSESVLRKVQLKSRWTIDKKYIGRDIWIAFPIENVWYLAPHDEMVASAEEAGTTKTVSWTDRGGYSRPRLSATLIAKCVQYRFTLRSKTTAEIS